MIHNKEVYIICAAIWFDDKQVTYQHQPKNITSGYIIAGRRHHNCFYTKAMLHGPSKFEGKIVQGFLTNTDLFLTRKEAAIVAYEARQVPELHDQLISEHLY